MSSTPAAGELKPVILRSWPKIVLMLPTMFMAIACGIVMSIYGLPASDVGFSSIHLINLVFLLVLAINLMLLLYDLSLRGFLIVALSIIALVLGLFLINQSRPGVFEAIGGALSVRVAANSAFYFLFAVVLLVNLIIAWIITRFHYWVVEHNEIIIHKGFMHEQERHPTSTARFTLEIDDVVEYALFGSGKLVFTFSDEKRSRELTTVLRIRSKAHQLDLLLGRMAVTRE